MKRLISAIVLTVTLLGAGAGTIGHMTSPAASHYGGTGSGPVSAPQG